MFFNRKVFYIEMRENMKEEIKTLINKIATENNDKKLENIYEQLLAKLQINSKIKQDNIKFLNELFNENFLEQDENGNTILHTAISLKLSSDVFEIIFLAYEPLEINDNMNEKEKAAREDYNIRLKTEFLELLNLQNNDGNTALHLAINYKQYELANKFISFGAQTNIKNNKQKYALHLVLKPVFKKLLANKIFEENINAINENGETSLMLTARYGFLEVAEILILLGADITKREKRYNNDVYSWINNLNYNTLKDFLFLYPFTKDIYTRNQLMTMIKQKNPK